MVSSGDLEDRGSDELANAIERVLEGEDVEEPATLDGVRAALADSAQARSAPLRRLAADEREALIAELDGLIDLHGGDTPAEGFVQPFSGADLTRVFEFAIERTDEPTLGHVQGMIEDGLLAELIGEGEVAEEDEQSIRAQLERLIEREGANAFAEDFIGST